MEAAAKLYILISFAPFKGTFAIEYQGKAIWVKEQKNMPLLKISRSEFRQQKRKAMFS